MSLNLNKLYAVLSLEVFLNGLEVTLNRRDTWHKIRTYKM